jgi:hypothetical protein
MHTAFADQKTRFGGLWEADDFSFEISAEVGNLIDKHHKRLDIIYDDELNLYNLHKVTELIFWNGTRYSP